MRIEQSVLYAGIDIIPEEASRALAERINKRLQRQDCIGFDIYAAEQKVGFALFRKNPDGCYFLWQYVIDHREQSKGYGTAALVELLSFLKTRYGAREVTTTYLIGNERAKRVYEKVGFIQTDVVDEDDVHEVNMAITLR